MGLFSIFSAKKPTTPASYTGNLSAQLSRSALMSQKDTAAALKRIKTEEDLFKTQSAQIDKLKAEIAALNKTLKGTEDKAQKDDLKKQVKGKEKEILSLEMKNYKSLLLISGILKAAFVSSGSNKPGQVVVDAETSLERAIFDLTIVLEGKLKPLVKNSVFTLIGKMAEKDLDIAYAAAKAVSEEPHSSWSLVEVAEKAVVSDPQRALLIIDEIKDPNAKALAYSKVTGKLISGVDTAEAHRISERFHDENARQWALGKIARKIR